MSNKEDFFGSLNTKEARDTTIHWPQVIQNIVDKYLPHCDISHAIQKDGIQNGWDARSDKKHGKEWCFSIELIKDRNGTTFLYLHDRGTIGLTGKVLTELEYFADLPVEERWGRFESLAFKNPSTESLGARGQGKFIFVAASSKKRILYDTLREDGIYRLGVRLVEITKSPIYCWEGKEAVKKLIEYSPDLRPLDSPGTRVIIDEPLPEVISALKSKKIERACGITWWPIIEKGGKGKPSIIIKRGKEEIIVTKPEDFVLPTKDDKRYQIWLKENDTVRYYGDSYRVKRIHLVHDSKGSVSEDIRGVAIYRGGMKVCAVGMRYVPQDIANSVYGYIEFDRELDEEIKKYEDPTHYIFDFSKGIARKIYQYIEDQLDNFAREKLGVGAGARVAENEKRKGAEKRALYAANRAAKILGITGKKGPGGGSGGGGERPTQKSIRIEMPEPTFPREIRRVNYGEKINDIKARVINDEKIDIKVALHIYIISPDGSMIMDLKKIDINIPSKSSSGWINLESVSFNASSHVPGQYSIKANLIYLGKELYKKGYELHKIAHKFWLEEDPPEKGIFEDIEGLDYGESNKIDGEVVPGEEGKYKFQYNIKHPAKQRWDRTEDELYDYLFRLMIRELVWIDLRSDKPKMFNGEELGSPERIIKRSSIAQGEAFYNFYL